MSAALAAEARPDDTFGSYAELFSLLRSSVYQEGRLLELAISYLAGTNPDLKVLPVQPLPIVPSAVELLKRNLPESIRGIRLPSEVHTSQTYTPDLFIAHRRRHTGMVIDVKRSLSSYREGEIDRLRFRMLAVSSIASGWLAERQGPMLVEVTAAIIDGSDEMSDHPRGVFGLSEIDDLIEVDGAADSIRWLRAMFSRLVQAELERRCRDVLESTSRRQQEDPLASTRLSEGVAAGTSNPLAAEAPWHGRVVPMPRPDQDTRFGFARLRRTH
ncbi:hypothetical protein GRZ55_06715 [Chelativorans sp. ZYF759]|uniref:hypothetical protein n=1 Tax=Chelativorans sp. ZYF759 TaxID=2692213 RepID=UPI00145D085E|nr:hypothetical protein [Chelativorans sp. ZYF759]NMG38932.1 hypothetical protein [Chelativorans sp. ZYF759]